MRYREPGICLRPGDFSETSQVVHFLTRGAGVVHLLAKGAKRPKSKSGGAIDLLSEGELVFTSSGGEGMGTVIEFSESTSHSALRRDAGRLYTALYMIELVGEALGTSDPHPEVFELLHNSLVRLAQVDAPSAAVLAYFQWRLLQYVGLLGDLKSCTECGKSIEKADASARRGVYFSSAQGGLICRDCEATIVEKLRLDADALAGVMVLQVAEEIKLTGRKVSLVDKQAHAVNRLLGYHVSQQFGKQLKLTRYAIPPARPRR
jgi:DNA repair protein RecO (recombination protein O)